MRFSPVSWAFDDLDQVLAQAACSGEITHNHPEGIKGAQGIAASILLARQGAEKALIKSEI
jgi:ADP-ribosyl-[dinitrogen reductase] hydrolase